MRARLTFYTDTRVAMSPKIKPVEGVTVAAAKKLKFGTKLSIPSLKGIVGNGAPFIVQDRGPSVEKRVASRGAYPIIDVFVKSRARVNELAKRKAMIVDVTVL
jgi:hypothetical protein